ncbi:MAG TPA: nitroreductase family deazaflavin-dependent oxidoreductase [Nitrososphaerales archaeon]|nr:nitroreductase family deazaflavin-dependent oxidoreductase [Nitrososphaerales archaeon]
MSVKKPVVAKKYRVNFTARAANAFVSFFLRLGLKFGSTALLTVKGRKTGIPRTNPVQIVYYERRRYLVAAYGQVNWVRNLRASHEAKLFHDRQSEVISVIEISPPEAAPILKHSLSSYPSYTRSYFQAKPDSAIELFYKDVMHHPVFEICEFGLKR